MTLAHHIAHGATCKCSASPRATRRGAAVLQEVRDARWAQQVCTAWRRPDGPSSPARGTRPSRCGATACERTIQATQTSMRWRCCRAGAVRQRSDDQTAKLWTLDGVLERTFEVGSGGGASRRCPTACTSWSAWRLRRVRLYHVDGRSSTFKAPQHALRALAVTPDGQHIISGSCDCCQGVERRQQEPVSTCVGQPATFARWRRCPTASASSACRHHPGVALDGTLQNTFTLHTAWGPGR